MARAVNDATLRVMKRRTLLTTGLVAGTLLTLVGATLALLQPARRDGKLSAGARVALTAVARAVIGPLLPQVNADADTAATFNDCSVKIGTPFPSIGRSTVLFIDDTVLASSAPADFVPDLFDRLESEGNEANRDCPGSRISACFAKCIF